MDGRGRGTSSSLKKETIMNAKIRHFSPTGLRLMKSCRELHGDKPQFIMMPRKQVSWTGVTSGQSFLQASKAFSFTDQQNPLYGSPSFYSPGEAYCTATYWSGGWKQL